MPSKTPKFEAAIKEILKDLKPHKKNCKQCGVIFDVFAEDIKFYKKFQVPAPTLCPDCRMQRRFGYRISFLPIFYKRNCDAPDHKEKIISFYSQENKIKVYDDDYYFSDKWDAMEFSIDYDFNKSFFEQFYNLNMSTPHQSLFHDPQSVNCDYVVGGVSAKNCYYSTTPYFSENIYYSVTSTYSRDCLDLNESDNCELCYEGVYIVRCYNCKFCYYSSNCIDSAFLYNCRNCSNCFGCVNLRNKKYYFFNKPLTKEEYEDKINKINLGKTSVLKYYQKMFHETLTMAINRNVNNVKIENSFGDNLNNCKNCFYAFRVIGKSGYNENLRYYVYGDGVNYSMDMFGASHTVYSYESTGSTSANNMKFCVMIRTGLEMEYCVECNNCEYCFGCVGLKNKKYCIFNKQYSADEYWELVDNIKSAMLKNKEYGEFFPLKHSPFNYGDSNASIQFPLSKEEILKNNWHFEKEKESIIDLSRFTVLKSKQVPDDIADISDDILKSAIICEETGKPFLITGFELEFYRKHNLPLPTIHPLQRIKNRFSLMRPFRLWQYPCSKCGEMMHSSIDLKKKLKVYCEKCYQQEVV